MSIQPPDWRQREVMREPEWRLREEDELPQLLERARQQNEALAVRVGTANHRGLSKGVGVVLLLLVVAYIAALLLGVV